MRVLLHSEFPLLVCSVPAVTKAHTWNKINWYMTTQSYFAFICGFCFFRVRRIYSAPINHQRLDSDPGQVFHSIQSVGGKQVWDHILGDALDRLLVWRGDEHDMLLWSGMLLADERSSWGPLPQVDSRASSDRDCPGASIGTSISMGTLKRRSKTFFGLKYVPRSHLMTDSRNLQTSQCFFSYPL